MVSSISQVVRVHLVAYGSERTANDDLLCGAFLARGSCELIDEALANFQVELRDWIDRRVLFDERWRQSGGYGGGGGERNCWIATEISRRRVGGLFHVSVISGCSSDMFEAFGTHVPIYLAKLVVKYLVRTYLGTTLSVYQATLEGGSHPRLRSSFMRRSISIEAGG